MLRMGCVAVSNVVPFRRAVPVQAPGEREARNRRRSEQRSLLDAVYATGSLIVAAEDRTMKLTASRLQVYGFLAIEELADDGTVRRLRPSEAIRARIASDGRSAPGACRSPPAAAPSPSRASTASCSNLPASRPDSSLFVRPATGVPKGAPVVLRQSNRPFRPRSDLERPRCAPAAPRNPAARLAIAGRP
jgi:hypothetical protein